MLLQNIVGQPANSGNNALVNGRSGQLGDAIVSELHGRYYETTYRGNSFLLSVSTAAAVTAYSGGAAGTPMLAIFNPVGSGKNAVITKVSVGNVVAASAAGTVAFGLYFGTTATAITQSTTTLPWNMGTQLQSGSLMTGFRNVALTGGAAANNVIPIASYYWATAAGAANVTPQVTDLEGSIIIPPGSYAALGGSAALTSATWIGSLQWEEVPV
jgi:hypothetical protein